MAITPESSPVVPRLDHIVKTALSKKDFDEMERARMLLDPPVRHAGFVRNAVVRETLRILRSHGQI